MPTEPLHTPTEPAEIPECPYTHDERETLVDVPE